MKHCKLLILVQSTAGEDKKCLKSPSQKIVSHSVVLLSFSLDIFIAVSWSVRASVSKAARRSLIEIARKIIFISKSSQTFLCLVLQSSFVLLFSSFFALIVVFLTLVLVELSEITGELILKFLTATRIF